jgi:hypothetical protein
MVKNTIIESNTGIFSLFHQSYINPINTSKLFAGMLMILMNIGSKYIDIGLTKSQEHALRNGLGREIVIFCVVFLGTRDLILSLIMTAVVIILFDHLFNETSKFCIMPHKMKQFADLIDTSGDGIISPAEEKRAMEILAKAKVLRTKQQQGDFLSYMNTYSNQTAADEYI